MARVPRKPTSKPSRSTLQAQPKGWPPEVGYINNLIYSKSLTSDERSAVVAPPSSAKPSQDQREALESSQLVRICQVTSPATHPARGQYGLFAARHLPAGTLIIHYLGFVHGLSDTDSDSNYDISLDSELGIGIDAARMGNEARFINDYRGIQADGPNAEFRETMVGNERRMSVYVMPEGTSKKNKRGIRKGDEICVSYGKGFWKARLVGKEWVESASSISNIAR